MNIRSLKISKIVSLSHSAFCFHTNSEKRGSENDQKLIFPLLPGMHIVHYTVLSFIPVSHSVFCFIFYNNSKHCVMLNKAVSESLEDQSPQILSHADVQSSHQESPGPVLKRYFSMNMHVSALIVDLMRMVYIIHSTLLGQNTPLTYDGVVCTCSALTHTHTHTHMHSVWQ